MSQHDHPTADIDSLPEIYQRMLERYGPQHWWPAESRFEVMVGAVLTQAAAWTNVEKAIANLKSAGVLSPPGIRKLDQDELARLVYPSGYYNAKARKLKALVEYLGQRYDDDLDAMSRVDSGPLRAELMAVHGIGEETADDILLYALDKPVFVIDEYTKRLSHRLGLASDKGPYEDYQRLFAANLPEHPEMLGEYHALIVAHSVSVCKKREPLCHYCCLLDLCPTGETRVAMRPRLAETGSDS